MIDALIGKPFVFGRQDCYTIIREFYKLAFDLDLTDFARTEEWMDRDLWSEMYKIDGFQIINHDRHQLQLGDILAIAINTSYPTHGAVYLGNNKVLHQRPNSVGCVDDYKGILYNGTLAAFRHPQADLSRIVSVEHRDFFAEYPTRLRMRAEALRRRVAEG